MKPEPVDGSREAQVQSDAGIIDTIGQAFALLNRRPYLIWMPIALDLLLWSGLRFTINGPAWLQGSSSAASIPILDSVLEIFRSFLTDTEIFGLAASAVPTLLTEPGRDSVEPMIGHSVTTISSSAAMVLIPGVLLLMMAITMIYLTIVGRLVSGKPAWGRDFSADCFWNVPRVFGVMSLLFLLFAFLLVPFAFVGWGLQAAGIETGGLLAVVAAMYAMWIILFFFFSPQAIALGVHNPFAALQGSFRVVQRYLLSTLGLLVTILLIRLGTPIALQAFTESRWSLPLAIVVNAYVATALVAATMIFFRDRYSRLFDTQLANPQNA